MFCYEYPPLGGGGGCFARDLLYEIAHSHQDVEVDLVTFGNYKFPPFISEQFGNVKVHRIGKFLPRKNRATSGILLLLAYPFFAIPKGIMLSLRNKYSRVYSVFTFPSGFVGAIVSILFNKRHYVTVIGGDIYKPTEGYSPHKHLLLKVAARRIINNAYKVNAISTDVREKIYKFYGVKKEVEVGHIGIPFTTLTNLRDHKFDLFTFVALGRLDTRKGYDIMIKAFAILPQTSECQLLIISDGPEKGHLLRLIDELGVSSRVHLLGYVSDKEKYQIMAKSHCFVLSSYHEGFGLAYIEALNSSLPVVSTANGGVEDIVSEGYNGLLSPVGDIEGLSENMSRIMQDQELYTKLLSNSRKSVAQFNITSVTNNYLSFLDLNS